MRGEAAAAAAAAAATRPGKRPMRALTVTEKIEAIERVHDGESKASVARDIGVPESTLRGWCKAEHKIRAMARNSATPDSEAAHSPASSSGNPASCSGLGHGSTAGAHNHSEDESAASPPKRMRTEDPAALYAASATDLTTNGYAAAAADYLNLINNLISAGSITPAQGAVLCQQLGLFPAPAAKQQSQQLSFVENGLQYSSSSRSHKRASTSSAVAPTSHVDSKSGATRRSLPAAAEAPLASLPLSPRRVDATSAQQQQQQQTMLHYNQLAASSSGSVNYSSSSSSSKKADSALLMWLDHQQQYASQQQPLQQSQSHMSNDWFWQYCKNYGGAALLAAASNLVSMNSASFTANMNNSRSSIEQVAAAAAAAAEAAAAATASAAVGSSNESAGGKYKKSKRRSVRKSPSKARALVESAVCMNNNNNNNNECNRRSLNVNSMNDDVGAMQQQQQPSTATTEAKEGESNISFEEALQHAKIFGKWLDQYSDPSVCLSQIVQFRVMLNNLERKVNTATPPVVAAARRTRKSSAPYAIIR